MGHLREDAAAVAGQRIAAAGAAMGEIDENLKAASQHVMRALAVNIDDEADAAGVVLVGRIVKTSLASAR